MADVQILRSAAGAVPIAYTLPDAAELRLKAVYAEYTDTGAVQDWLPCVTILSDSGDVIGRAVDQGVKVTAGFDADVTWFPGVKHGGGAATAGAHDLLMMLQRAPAQSIPDSVGTFLEFGAQSGVTFFTNAAGDWSFDDTGAGDHYRVHCLVPGIYRARVHVTFGFPAGNYNKQLNLLANSLEPNPPLTQTTVDDGFDTFAVDYECNYIFAISSASVGAANNSLSASVFQSSGGAVAIDAAVFEVLRLGSVFP